MEFNGKADMTNIAKNGNDQGNKDLDNAGFSYNSLESIRGKLLDLSKSNNLINFKFAKSSSLRIIDVDFSKVFSALITNDAFQLKAVPQPTEEELLAKGYVQNEQGDFEPKVTAEEWAKIIGINTGYDLSAIEVGDNDRFYKRLQTLFFADDLEAISKRFRQTNQSSLEESGVHILYLVFGFVEWFESRDSNIACSAPLITIPVEFSQNGNKSTLALKDDGSEFINQTFREKLQQDFGFDLPDFDHETQSIRDYVVEVEALFKEYDYPRWKVKVEMALTTRINFSKQVMYQDLDPDKWPLSASIEHHPIVKALFAKEGTENPGGLIDAPREYQIDTIDEIEDTYPIIYDADSSQHSALIDAIKGRNLVIEGPPGTGKSQTITNLIAACINNDLKVLFVAEKMAALNVVKSRLDYAGLGEFCLELHSHKANKTAVLDDLKTSLSREPIASVSAIDDEINVLARYRDQLNDYVEVMNSTWRNTGRTPAQIFAKATALKFELDGSYEPLMIEGVDGHSYDTLMARELDDQIKTIAEIAQKMVGQSGGAISDHPWWGLVDEDSSSSNIEKIQTQIKQYAAILETLLAEGAGLKNVLHVDLTTLDLSYEEMEALYCYLETMPALTEEHDFELLSALLERTSAEEIVRAYIKISTAFKELSLVTNASSRLDKELTQKNQNLLTKIIATGYLKEQTIHALKDDCEEIRAIIEISEQITGQLPELKELLPLEMKDLANGAFTRLETIELFVQMIEALPQSLWELRHKRFLRKSLSQELEQVLPTIRLLQQKHDLLGIHFRLTDTLPASNILKAHFNVLNSGGFFSFLSAEWRNAKAFFNLFSFTQKLNGKRLKELVPHLIEYQSLEQSVKKALSNNALIKALYRGVETNVDGIETLLAWYERIKDTYGKTSGKSMDLAVILYEYSYDELAELKDFWRDSMGNLLERFAQLHKTLQQKFVKEPDLEDRSIKVNDLNKGYPALLQSLENTLISFSQTLSTFDLSLSEVERILSALITSHKNIEQLEELRQVENCLDAYLSQDLLIEDFAPEILVEVNQLMVAAEYLNKLPNDLLTVFKSYCSFVDYNKWATRQFSSIAKHHDVLKVEMARLEESGLLNIALWHDLKQHGYQEMLVKNQRALGNVNALYTMQEFLHIYEKEKESNLRSVLSIIFAGDILPKDIVTLWRYSIFYQLGHEILRECRLAGEFSSFEQEGLRQRFIEADRQLLHLQRQRIIAKERQKQAPIGVSTGAVKQLTEASLIKHEGNKKTRHIPIRSLLSRAQESIQTLKPCFMMSPMSVAQFLEPGKYHFDIVIMDEASQIRPEDAIGAIARANSAVIVGDPKQLPPTSFFQRSNDADSDDEDVVVAETTESILDTVIPIFTNRRLRWHYRSRHEKLIEFSNYHFYENDLVVFPSPEDSDRLGLEYRKVDGMFVGNQNAEEARLMVDEVARLLTSGSSMSIGLVAMNIKQSQLIEDLLEEKVNSDPHLRALYMKNLEQEEPIFIKNLENVQGDERDIIMISMTYGPKEPGGRTLQRFGPINRDSGWRRLNVLFTRAKYKMIIFSSMTSGDVLASEGKSRGVVALKNFLIYCETKKIAGHISIDETKGYDSDFEAGVAKALRDRGFDSQPQLGIAGYYLDLAVKNPQNPGEYLMGIECDGATYHSAKSARDRDRLRQQVLEGLGWQIERIWSTDWFKHPEREIDRIVGELEKKMGA